MDMNELSLNDRSKVIGYYARAGDQVYSGGLASCLVFSSQAALKEHINRLILPTPYRKCV